MDNVPHKGVGEEKDRQGDRGQNRSFPGGEEMQWHILDLFGRGERTHVHRDESELTGHFNELLSSVHRITANIDL